MRKFFKNPCNIYILLWCVYLLQGTIYVSGSLISQAVLALILLFSLKHTVQCMMMLNRPLYFKGLDVLVGMYVVYGLLLIIVDGKYTQATFYQPPTINYLKGYLMSILPIYSCYYYSLKGYMNSKLLQRWGGAFIVVALLVYNRMESLTVKMVGGAKEVTNNAGYYMLSLIPFMMIYDKKPILQYVGIGLCVVYIISAMKRGAIIIGALMLVVFILYKMRSAKRTQKILVIFATMVSMLLLVNFIETKMETSEYFNKRIEQTKDGDSSTRDELFSLLWNAFKTEDNEFVRFFGHGADGTLKIVDTYAHNDWLETLTNQGLLGIAIFAFYWWMFFRTSRSLRLSRWSKVTISMCLLMGFLRTFFSMSIGDMTIYGSCILGYALNNGLKKEEELIFNTNEINSKNITCVELPHA